MMLRTGHLERGLQHNVLPNLFKFSQWLRLRHKKLYLGLVLMIYPKQSIHLEDILSQNSKILVVQIGIQKVQNDLKNQVLE